MKNSDTTSWHELYCTSSSRFAPSFVRQPNGPECTQLVRNTTKCQFRVRWGVSGAFVAKNSDATSCHKLLHKFGPFCTKFRKTNKQSRMHPNSTKRTKTSVSCPMEWIGCVRCEKFRRDFVARTFALVRPVERQPNGPECTQIVRNAPKCQFRIQWGGSGAFLAKNSDATLWHKLLHNIGPFCTEFRKATKSRMHTNSTKCTKTSV